MFRVPLRMGHDYESQNPPRVEIHGIPPGFSLVPMTYWQGTSRRVALVFIGNCNSWTKKASFYSVPISPEHQSTDIPSSVTEGHFYSYSYLGCWELILVHLIRRTTSPILERRNVATLPLPSRKARPATHGGLEK